MAKQKQQEERQANPLPHCDICLDRRMVLVKRSDGKLWKWATDPDSDRMAAPCECVKDRKQPEPMPHDQKTKASGEKA
jgi:hypothetical protein